MRRRVVLCCQDVGSLLSSKHSVHSGIGYHERVFSRNLLYRRYPVVTVLPKAGFTVLDIKRWIASSGPPVTGSPLPPVTNPSLNVGTGGGEAVAMEGPLPVSYSPGSGVNGSLPVTSTAITAHCDVLSECVAKADELAVQLKAQNALSASAEILTQEGMEEFVEELKTSATNEMTALVKQMQTTPLLQRAGMHELRRTLYYTTSLKERDWLEEKQYTAAMRMLTVEVLRRDGDGVLSADDVLYVTTHVVTANFYNRHLWNRMEKSLLKFSNYENIDMSSVKAFSTRLFKTRRGCAKETLDIRRKVLLAMSRRVGVLANDFDLPSLLGVLQCYTVHDLTPFHLEPLAIRATNHVGDFTPHECATLAHVLRKWRTMRLEVCERLVERICTSDQLTHHMANAAMIAIRTCFNQVSDGGRNAMNAEPTRQKLRAMGEQIGCRLDEVEYPALPVILSILDVVVTLKIYVPKKCLQVIFSQANDMVAIVMEQKDDLVDPKTGKRVRPITAEEGRQLQALLSHYGNDLAPELSQRMKEAFREGVLPDEASL
ncbi:mitochondrial RNA binding complex 1 subunit [Trypanosoma brucei equiperdum]|uniref:Mitochondrial RNA binding complex 1 subunit n=1 Tax=Trypanosoma brucei equiperdum TaxID=630700 RepID=A0A3L6L6S4_9TRYP|nr:mitochondrial RNA binding complex 1 subunit [Trypanosoma brucei equiperdum]